MTTFRVQIVLIRLLVQALFFIALHAAASDPEKDLREMDMASSYDPGGAIDRGEEALRTARASGDKPAELKALLLLSMSRANIGETPNHRDDEARGEALARALGNVHALCWFIDSKAWIESYDGRKEDAK